MAKLTKGETDMLLKRARRQERVAIEHIKAASAARKAEFEARVATIFGVQDAEWRDIVDEAKRGAALANAHIARCPAPSR